MRINMDICKLPTPAGEPDEYRAADVDRWHAATGATPGGAANILVEFLYSLERKGILDASRPAGESA